MNEKRKVTNPGKVERDALVESVVSSKESANDSNEDIIDRVTGHEVKKPGSETRHGDIVVPMPANGSNSAPPPAAKKEKPEKPEKKSGSGMEL